MTHLRSLNQVWIAVVSMLVVMYIHLDAQPARAQQDTAGQFLFVDVLIDSGAQELGAYQFQLSDPTGRTTIVGVEGGSAKAFSKPPYYDPAALAGGKIIIAAFNVDDELPKGEVHVARLHLHVDGGQHMDFDLKLHTAADADGSELEADIRIAEDQ